MAECIDRGNRSGTADVRERRERHVGGEERVRVSLGDYCSLVSTFLRQ